MTMKVSEKGIISRLGKKRSVLGRRIICPFSGKKSGLGVAAGPGRERTKERDQNRRCNAVLVFRL